MRVLRMGAALVGGLLMTMFVGEALQPMSSASAVGAEHAAQVRAVSGWLSVRAGGLYTCGIRLDHTLWCWGANDVGQLGLGDTKERATPSQVGHRTDWAALVAGFDHTCATRTDHSLWCWGSGRAGQLGLEQKGGRTAPSRVGADNDWTGVVAGFMHTCGIRTDHSLWCWGGASFAGQLGMGDHTDRSRPTRVGVRTDWAVVRGGDAHNCALRTDDTLWCWGYNGGGQLGLGDLGNRSRPLQVGKGADWADISAVAGHHTCALRSNHTLWCWGFNSGGQLGLGDTKNRTTPTQVGTSSNWRRLNAGHGQTCATRRNHTLWCWGFNGEGQLGVGDTTGRAVPTQVGMGVNWAAISAAGERHTCALRSNHTLWCWGLNSQGQLGLGDHEKRLVPTRV